MTVQKSYSDESVVVFNRGPVKCALKLSGIERVVRSVEITPLPDAPQKVLGIINYHGELIPVINTDFVFGLKNHLLSANDLFLVACTNKHKIALVADSVDNVHEPEIIKTKESLELMPFAEYISSITVFDNDIVLINDIDKFLSLAEFELISKLIKTIK